MKQYISSSSRNGYLYIFKHGIGPGTLPGDVRILKTKDLPNYYTAVWLDRFLTDSEMKQYDIPFETDINYYLDRIGYCQKNGDVVPCDDVEACDQITSSEICYRDRDNDDRVVALDAGMSEDDVEEMLAAHPSYYRSTLDEFDDVEACDDVMASDDDFDDDFDEEDEIYWVQAYYSKPHRGLADDFATNDWDAALDKLVEYANQGYYAAIDNLASGDGRYYDPDEVLDAVELGDIYILRGLENLFEGQ